jgi:hypothetical protein
MAERGFVLVEAVVGIALIVIVGTLSVDLMIQLHHAKPTAVPVDPIARIFFLVSLICALLTVAATGNSGRADD